MCAADMSVAIGDAGNPECPNGVPRLYPCKCRPTSLQSRRTCALYELAIRKHTHCVYAATETLNWNQKLHLETHVAKEDLPSIVKFTLLGKFCEGHRKDRYRNCNRLGLWGAGLPKSFQTRAEHTLAEQAACYDTPEPRTMPARESRCFNSVWWSLSPVGPVTHRIASSAQCIRPNSGL